MKDLNFTRRLYWIIALLVFVSNALIVTYLYGQFTTLFQKSAYTKAKILEDYFISMRRVYHHQFLASTIDLNDSTVGFLPAHASALISSEFSRSSKQGITIRNVSDNPRNEINRADPIEIKAIDYFTQHPNQQEKIETIRQNGKDFYFYTAPLRIEAYCLACHGSKEHVIPYIVKRYDNAYNYKIGDVRGITSIKIPKELIVNQFLGTYWKSVVFNFTILLIVLYLMFLAVKQLTKNAEKRKKELEGMVKERTLSLEQKGEELQKTFAQKEHLFSVLKTVADTNKILITAQTLHELLQQVALCLYQNPSFAQVRILLFENGTLHVKQSLGFDETTAVYPIETYAFEHQTSLKMLHNSPELSEECQKQFAEHSITESYTIILVNNKNANTPLGVLHVCTLLKNGFSNEEHNMIEELAGDIGFAINSFLQKDKILKLSYYDTLTLLANRVLLREEVIHAIETCKQTSAFGALLFIDLDNFKSINDLKGHSAGDALLQMMAKRLTSLAPRKSTVARFGGNEFALLLSTLNPSLQESAEEAEHLAQILLNAIKEPFIIEGHSFHMTASIGISLLSAEDNAEQILSKADSAMYLAKQSGKNTIRFFDENIQHLIEHKSLLLHELHQAIEMKQFSLYYQVQVNYHREIIGVEALIRWAHPSKKFISPMEFIPLCEESGLIVPLGQWVLEEAIQQCLLWRNDPQKAHWRISINVSAKQFQQETFVSLVETALSRSQVPPHLLRLELTESLLIGDIKKAMEKIERLKALGVSLSIDDFGTGYSSLQYLKQLSLDEIKIDQSFIKDCLHDKNDASIVEAILSMGQKLGIDVIAEGVETQEQFEYLTHLGCLYFQGYFFGKPSLPEHLI